jgi:cytosine deaminase
MSADLHRSLLARAAEAAQRNAAAGWVPIGAAVASADGTLLAVDANRNAQDGDLTAHAEISAARAVPAGVEVRGGTLATTLVPCWMCAGMIDHLGISTVVIGDVLSWPDRTPEWLRSRGIDVIEIDDPATRQLLAAWTAANPELWHAD